MTGPLTDTQLGPYRLLGCIGQGAYAQVFAARRSPSPGGSPAPIRALKVFSLRGVTPDARVLLADEANLSVRLHHPRLVRAYDFGRVDDLFYIEMDLVLGPSLLQLLMAMQQRGTRLPPSAVIHIGHSLADGLHYLHSVAEHGGEQLKVVHRDVSPQNILLTDQGDVLLTDFGAARFSQQLHVTQGAMVVGKPGYLSPEQARGETAGVRSDLFALGVVVWECSAGRPLFAGRDANVLDAQAPALQELVPDVPKPLHELVHRALEVRPEGRPRNALAMLSRFELMMESHPDGRAALAKHVQELFPRERYESALERMDDTTSEGDAVEADVWPTTRRHPVPRPEGSSTGILSLETTWAERPRSHPSASVEASPQEKTVAVRIEVEPRNASGLDPEPLETEIQTMAATSPVEPSHSDARSGMDEVTGRGMSPSSWAPSTWVSIAVLAIGLVLGLILALVMVRGCS